MATYFYQILGLWTLTTKTCTRCKTDKSLTDFNKSKKHKDNLQYYCRSCVAEVNKEYMPSRWRGFHLRNKYNISEEFFNKLLEDQNGLCALCGVKPKGTLCVDHEHSTGRIRGLLCRNCNVALGLFNDDSNVLSKASKYVSKETPSQSV